VRGVGGAVHGNEEHHGRALAVFQPLLERVALTGQLLVFFDFDGPVAGLLPEGVVEVASSGPDETWGGQLSASGAVWLVPPPT